MLKENALHIEDLMAFKPITRNTRAKRLRMRKVYFQIGGCECELHNKNACF